MQRHGSKRHRSLTWGIMQWLWIRAIFSHVPCNRFQCNGQFLKLIFSQNKAVEVFILNLLENIEAGIALGIEAAFERIVGSRRKEGFLRRWSGLFNCAEFALFDIIRRCASFPVVDDWRQCSFQLSVIDGLEEESPYGFRIGIDDRLLGACGKEEVRYGF